MVWDQVGTVAINTRYWAGIGRHVVKAFLPLSWNSILASTVWVAELLGEERFLHWSEFLPVANISRQAKLISFEVRALHVAGRIIIIAGASWWYVARVLAASQIK